ncbi:DPP IV N-terminal domain-containing protein [Candidatus Palauibacter sp.]|uniref:S9 family peptidase n=1 Tax=Candidatus Palauibacter sp. TaxID=3101350 RepID=UPI003C6EDB62
MFHVSNVRRISASFARVPCTAAALVIAVLAVVASASPASGQDAPAALTAADYERAERCLWDHTDPLVLGGWPNPQWLEDGRFWYWNRFESGSEYIIVDPAAGTRERAFDHARVAAALSAQTGEEYTAFALPRGEVALEAGVVRFEVRAEGETYACRLAAARCEPVPEAEAAPGRFDIVSPDGANAAFIRDHNLWLRDLTTGETTQLTEDGFEDFGYATNNAGWTKSDRPVLRWSPDSRRIATFQHDGRGVGMMYMVTTEVGHPELEAWRYPLPEDSVIFRIHRVVIDTEAPAGSRVVRLDMPPDQHRSTVCDHVACRGTFSDVEWSSDGSKLVFVSSSRDHKRALVRVADTSTGAVRDLFEEVVETFFESHANWRYLSASDEILWYSQRDDWGHLYLYDASSGELKRQVTSGAWNVERVLRVDEEAGEILFMGNGREPGDPYFAYLYRAALAGGDLALLTPDSANHVVWLAPDGETFVDQYSTPTIPPVTVVRDMDGEVLQTVERADISRLERTGWQPPIPFTVKARDGETDLYGLMFRPSNLDPGAKHPVINYLYPGPQSGSVGSRSFRAAHRDLQSLAELGFVVVELDAMGTPRRSKTFQDAYYGNMGDNGLPDQIAGIRELAERHAWIDIDRVGIYGHSGGGFASTSGILRYPDFYKVAVSQAGNHDNRNYEDDWGEKYQGLLEEYSDGVTNYDNQANQLVAENLKGKLLIAHGTMDTNVPHSNTMLVVDALIAANKDFDLLLFPNRGHGFGNEPYMMRRRWDYFVRHLMGAEPPPEYEFGRIQPLVP